MFQLKYLKTRENAGKEVFLAKIAGTYLLDQARRLLSVLSKLKQNLMKLLLRNFESSLTGSLTNGIGTLVVRFPGKHGILIRCPDSNKCSDCPFGVKAEDRQLTIVNYSEPEELAIGISELDGIENEMDLEVISKEINRKDPKAGRVFDLLAFHGYQLEDIARMEGLTERQMRYIMNKIKKFGVSLMAR